jgi:phage portal protein BeeE
MRLFTRKSKPAVQAAAGVARYGNPTNSPQGVPTVGNFYFYTADPAADAALSVPTISRSRDLICSMIGCLTLKQYALQYNGEDMEKVYLPPDTWFQQPDPNVTRNFIMSWCANDLLLYGRAFWAITARLGNGFPSAFTWIPAGDVTTLDQSGPQWFGPSQQVYFQGKQIPSDELVQFLSPSPGIIYSGARAILTARRLDISAERFAINEVPAGYLKQTGGEPMTATDLAELASAFAQARQTNTIAALNEYVDFKQSDMDPNKMQLTEARTFQALEMARVANIPPYLVGAPTGGGMTYQNALQARQDLYLFGAKPIIEAMQQTLSMNHVTPRGRYIEFDVDSYLYDNDLTPEREQPDNALANN